MKGPIKRSSNFSFLSPKKGVKRGPKKKKKSKGSAFRDYRGVDGVVDDAQ